MHIVFTYTHYTDILYSYYTHRHSVDIPRLNQSNSPDGSASDEPLASTKHKPRYTRPSPTHSLHQITLSRHQIKPCIKKSPGFPSSRKQLRKKCDMHAFWHMSITATRLLALLHPPHYPKTSPKAIQGREDEKQLLKLIPIANKVSRVKLFSSSQVRLRENEKLLTRTGEQVQFHHSCKGSAKMSLPSIHCLPKNLE